VCQGRYCAFHRSAVSMALVQRAQKDRSRATASAVQRASNVTARFAALRTLAAHSLMAGSGHAALSNSVANQTIPGLDANVSSTAAAGERAALDKRYRVSNAEQRRRLAASRCLSVLDALSAARPGTTSLRRRDRPASAARRPSRGPSIADRSHFWEKCGGGGRGDGTARSISRCRRGRCQMSYSRSAMASKT
jgi:hypothetical protein